MALSRHRLLLIVVAFALVGAMATAGCSKSSKSAATTTTAKVTTTTASSANAGAVVDISEYLFSPATVTIKAGQSVEWKNEGNVAHTVTETSSPHTFASNDIEPGQSYTQTFNKAGTYTYVCSIHPDRMQGSITVTAAST
jgi:plastocyanin